MKIEIIKDKIDEVRRLVAAEITRVDEAANVKSEGKA